MKPSTTASALALLLAPVLLDPARSLARPFGHHDPDRADYALSSFASPIPPSHGPARPARGGWRRGQHLQPPFRGDIVSDYARHHLRRPPRGYLWYRDADDYVLAAVSTGLIFEVIPGY